jgi:hypothetical protein
VRYAFEVKRLLTRLLWRLRPSAARARP